MNLIKSSLRRLEYRRQLFWDWMWRNHPAASRWVEKHLPFIDTIPF